MTGQVLELPVKSTIHAAWEKTSSALGTFWAGIGIMFVITFSIGLLVGLTEQLPTLSGFFTVTGNLFGYFLQLSLIYIGITRAKDLPINYKMVFFTFKLDTALHLIGLYILQTLIFLIPVTIGVIGYILFNTGGVLLMMLGALIFIAAFLLAVCFAISLSLSMAFLLDTASGPLASIKKSLHATRLHFWNLGAIYLIMLGIILVSAIPFGLGLIWTLPLSMICYGLIYKRLSNNAV